MRLIIFIFIFFNFIYASNEVATKDDIKMLSKQIQQMQYYMDKRFEQIDKRFNQVDRRLDFHEKLIYILMGLVFASPFLAIYLKDKREEYLQKMADNIKAILFVLRELANEDEKLAQKLKTAGLL